MYKFYIIDIHLGIFLNELKLCIHSKIKRDVYLNDLNSIYRQLFFKFLFIYEL